MPNPSTIQILHNDLEDITRFAVFARTRFDSQMSAMPGTGTVTLKDPNKELSFVTGDTIKVVVDGVKLWGGLVMAISEGHFFPVVDSTNVAAVTDQMWILECSDFNLYMDKRVVRDPNDYIGIIYVGPAKIGAILRDAIPRYMDVPPGFDYVTHVQDTDYVYDDGNGGKTALPGNTTGAQQGGPWRQTLDRFADFGAYTWRVDADNALHFGLLDDLQPTWGFVDAHPNGVTSIGFREGTIRDDGSQLVTDALVWGGHDYKTRTQPEPSIVFARYPDPPANNTTARGIVWSRDKEQRAIDAIARLGRWQRAEQRIDQQGYFQQEDVFARAAAVVVGPSGTEILPGSNFDGLDGGLSVPLRQVSLSWFAHDVPSAQHLVPGSITPMVFYTFGDDPTKGLPVFLPLRSLSISFPTLPPRLPGDAPLTYVRFDGEFGISNSDSRYMWRYLRSGQDATAQSIVSTTDNSSTTTVHGSLAQFYPNELPDGSRTEFTLPFSYMAGTTEVSINGLLQRPRYEYVEASPSRGIIKFAVAPFSDDTIWVVCRTGAS